MNAAAGNAAKRLTSLNLKGSAYDKVPASCVATPCIESGACSHLLVALSGATQMHVVTTERFANIAAPRRQLPEAAAHRSVLGCADAGGCVCRISSLAACCCNTNRRYASATQLRMTACVCVVAGWHTATGSLPAAEHALTADSRVAAAGLVPPRCNGPPGAAALLLCACLLATPAFIKLSSNVTVDCCLHNKPQPETVCSAD